MPRPAARRKKNVALIIETSNDYARGILRGIHEFTLAHPEWSVYLSEHGRHEPDESFAGNWRGDGVIARIETERTAEIVRSLGVPAVDVSAARMMPGIPWVETNDEQIVRLAVAHLADCGLSEFAYFGDPFYNWSVWRERFFRAEMKRANSPVRVYNLPHRAVAQVRWYDHREAIRDWIQSLPKPVGVLACYDTFGQQLLEVCRYYDIYVPEDVAVVAVDNDELLCRFATPSLSSVRPNSQKTGLVAAELLDRMIDGERLDERKYEIDPVGVEQRVSTDMLTVTDPHVARAIAFIRAHRGEPICVDDVLQSVPLSRRVFEIRFKAALNRTPHQEILRVRTNAIRELLRDTNLTIAEIAEALGIEHAEYLSVLFKKQTGMTPAAYRNQIRGNAISQQSPAESHRHSPPDR